MVAQEPRVLLPSLTSWHFASNKSLLQLACIVPRAIRCLVGSVRAPLSKVSIQPCVGLRA